MKLFTEYNGEIYEIDTQKGTDLSLAIGNNTLVNAYYLGDPVIQPFRAGDFVGSVEQGGSVNCYDVSFNPHGNGTHTECVGHIHPEHESVNKLIRSYFLFARVISLTPENRNGDRVISADQLRAFDLSNAPALIIRTLPNSRESKARNYSGTNPVYIMPDAAQHIREQNIEHVLVDFPSVDREEDEGKLLSHREFWNVSGETRLHASITELIYVPDSVADGIYWLNLQIAPFESDASPSRPMLYPIKPRS